jgi:hypothetical protein
MNGEDVFIYFTKNISCILTNLSYENSTPYPHSFIRHIWL